MKKFLFTFTLLLIINFSFSQKYYSNFYLGMRGSLMTSWLLTNKTTVNNTIDYLPTFASEFGLLFGFQWTRNFALQTEFLLSESNQRYSIRLKYPYPENRIVLKTIVIPVLVRFRVKHAYTEIGTAFNIKRRVWFEEDGLSRDNFEDTFSNFGFSGVLGIGGEFQLNQNIVYNIGFRTNVGFTDWQGVDYNGNSFESESEDFMRSVNFGIYLVVRYQFKQISKNPFVRKKRIKKSKRKFF